MMTTRMSLKVLVGALAAVFIVHGCGRSRLSDREIRREQIRLNAETKKREIDAIKGDYTGSIDSGANKSQPVALHLEVIEAPFNDNGGIDPVMMPQLSGFLKFPFSGSAGGDEYLGFKITGGEYDPKRSKLELVVNHDQYGEIKLSLTSGVNSFSGNWQALSLSMTGTMTLIRGEPTAISQPGSGNQPPADNVQDQIGGSYVGFANDDARASSYAAMIQIRATNVPGQGMKLTADVRLSRGNDGTEFAIWKFDTVEFHPLTRKLTLRKEGSNENFIFTLSQGTLTGEWSSAVFGRMGTAVLSKDSPPRSVLPRAASRSGAHDICLKNFGESNLPPHAALTLTVTPDVTNDGKVRTQASIVFYLGDYSSSEREICVLEQVDLDYISGRFQGVCRSIPDTPTMTISGKFEGPGFKGRLTAGGSNGADIEAGRCQEVRP